MRGRLRVEAVLVLCVTFGFAGQFGGTVMAEEPSLAVAWQVDGPEPVTRDFREEWNQVWSRYAQLAELLQDARLQQLVDQASLLSWKDEDLARMKAAQVDFRPLRDALDDLIQRIVEQTAGTEAMPRTALSPGLPGAAYSALCGSGRNDTATVFAAQVALQIAKGVWAAASRACDQVAVVAGFGANTSLACIAADVILFAAEAVLEDFKFCDEDIDAVEIEGSYERLAHVHEDVAAVDSAIGTIDDKVDLLEQKIDVIDGKIDTLDQKVDAALSALEDVKRQNCEIIRLLHTPQGLRTSAIDVCGGQPGFPYDWPGDQPLVP